MRIVRIGDGEDDRAEWDAYVAPRTGTVTDLFAWRRVVWDSYRIRSHFFTAIDDGRVVGALGLFEIAHPIFGHYLTTAVFSNDGGLYVDTPAARAALVAEARHLADRLKVSYLAIRTRDSEIEGFQVDRHYRTAILDLEGGSEALWTRLSNKTRNQVRRGLKEGFSLDTGLAQMDAFFDVLHEHMRDLGSPAHGRRFYQAVAEHLGDRTDVFVVRDGRELAAGGLLFWINGTAMNWQAVALRRFNRRCPNYLLYWKMIEASAARGCRRLDMGRSEAGSPNMQFKSNWGPDELTLRYNYDLVTADEVPYLDPRNAKFRLAIAAWQRLPLWLTRRLGPRLIAGLA